MRMPLIFSFLVSNAVQILGKDWKGLLTPEELEILQYEVCLNGVQKDIQHVLDSEVAKYRELDSDQMYNVVKCHESYIAWNKRLQGKGTYSGQTCASQPTNLGYKPHFQKATAFSALTSESPDSAAEHTGSVEGPEEGLFVIDLTSEEAGGSFLPDFLSEAPVGGNWALNVRMARAIQADEQLKKHCFTCQSPDHFIRDCPQAKNGQRPPQLRRPPKNNPASAIGKAKTQLSMPTLQEPLKSAPLSQTQ